MSLASIAMSTGLLLVGSTIIGASPFLSMMRRNYNKNTESKLVFSKYQFSFDGFLFKPLSVEPVVKPLSLSPNYQIHPKRGRESRNTKILALLALIVLSPCSILKEPPLVKSKYVYLILNTESGEREQCLGPCSSEDRNAWNCSWIR